MTRVIRIVLLIMFAVFLGTAAFGLVLAICFGIWSGETVGLRTVALVARGPIDPVHWETQPAKFIFVLSLFALCAFLMLAGAYAIARDLISGRYSRTP